MALTNNEVISSFRLITGSTTSQISDTALAQFITVVLAEHDPNKSIGDYSSSSEKLMLAWSLAERYHKYRAGKAAEAFPVSQGGEGYTDKSVTVKNHLKMAAEAREEYETLALALGSGRGTIQVSHILRESAMQEAMVPSNLVMEPIAVTVTAAAGTEKVTLSWNKPPMRDFDCYKIYYHTSSGLSDPASVTRPGATWKGVIDAAEHDKTLSNQWDTVWEVDGLTTGTTYYFVVVVENKNGQIKLSNEVSATPT